MTEVEKETLVETPGTFKIKMENPKMLKSLVETLSGIIDETIFKITPNEFSLKAMDPSRICIFQVNIEKENFENFKCDKTVEIGLNLVDFNKILKRISNNDTITIENDNQNQKIKIKSKSDARSRTKSFSLSIIDLEIKEIPIENLKNMEYPSYWKMNPDFLLEAIKDAEIYSESIIIQNTIHDNLIFKTTGMIGEMEYELDDEQMSDSFFRGEQSGEYMSTFLKSILKIISITQSFEISLKTDNPIKFDIDLLDGGKLIYFQAPKVDNDLDDDEF